jgi:hypothetical protein
VGRSPPYILHGTWACSSLARSNVILFLSFCCLLRFFLLNSSGDKSRTVHERSTEKMKFHLLDSTDVMGYWMLWKTRLPTCPFSQGRKRLLIIADKDPDNFK